MAFVPMRNERGMPRVSCKCDNCGREEVVCADHGRGKNCVGQAVPKLEKLGWVYLKKRLLCGTCDAARKVVKVNEVKGRDTALPREPSKAQKREIMDLLGEVYDTESERYRRGDTDETVADVLGVMPGWVAQLREEFYGPSGGNEDMSALAADVAEFLSSANSSLEALKQYVEKVSGLISEATEIAARLKKIEGAVGPRLMSRVK